MRVSSKELFSTLKNILQHAFRRKTNRKSYGKFLKRDVCACCMWSTVKMKIASLGLAGGRSYDRTNSLRTPTMKESQLLREKTTSSVFVSTCSNAVDAQFHWLAYTRNTRPCDVVCLQSKHFRSIAGKLLAPRADLRARSIARWNMKHFRQTARGCLLHQ